MRRPSDQEYKLLRKIKDLEELNNRLEDENKKLKKQLEKDKPKEYVKKAGKAVQKPCPDCGAEVKSTDLPHAVMELCSGGCGYRNIRNKK